MPVHLLTVRLPDGTQMDGGRDRPGVLQELRKEAVAAEALAGGRQYVTVMTGLSRVSKGRITLTPELREMRNQTMLFVFGL